MPSSTSKSLSRRTFLKGLGVSIALPALDAMQPALARQAAPLGQPRMVMLYVPNGVNIMKWTPPSAATSIASATDSSRDAPLVLSPTLEALAGHRDDITLLTGLGHPAAKGGHSGADTWLTAADLQGTPGYDYRNSISVDQWAAETLGRETRIPSLQISSMGGTGKPGHSQTLSFNRDGVPLPAEHRPRAVFNRLFLEPSQSSRTAQRLRYQEDRSILDLVRGEARSLERSLGARDRQKLDEYLTSVREVEQRALGLENWLDKPKSKVDPGRLALDAEPDVRGDRHTYFRTMLDLVVLALQTDTTRICTFQMGREAAGGYYDELGLKPNHHELSHHGGDPDMLDGLFRIDRFLLAQLGYFLDRLQGADEQDASLLARTVILYGSGMNSGAGGGHSPKNLPLLVAGGRQLGLNLGRHLAFQDDSTPLANAFVAMLQGMGLPVDRFADSTGSLAGLS